MNANGNKLCINKEYLTIKAFDDYRAWTDHTFASSCERYRYPGRARKYEGDVIYYFNLLFLFLY